MYSKISRIFKVKELRNKILFITFILVVFRFAANIPIPVIDVERLRAFFEDDQFLGLLNLFSGGGLKNISIIMLGVGPYITASIIMQLLTMIFPRLEQMYKEEGEAGRQKFNMWTRWLTVPLAAIQAFAMIALLRSQNLLDELTLADQMVVILTATAGTVFLMWLGELITEKGIGNGVSLIIFAGIVAELPSSLVQMDWDSTRIFTYLGFVAMALFTIIVVVLVTEGQRNIPVSFAKRVRGNKSYGGISTHLPLRVNQAGVIPIIFAMSIMLFPNMIANFLVKAGNPKMTDIGNWVLTYFNPQHWVYGVLYFILVVAFTYFYTAVTFDPKNVAENLQKQGGFIPGIRPGLPSMEYLNRIVNRITLTGALFLGAVAILPFVAQAFFPDITSLSIGGTGILIVVSVVIETMKQIDAQLVMRDYEGF